MEVKFNWESVRGPTPSMPPDLNHSFEYCSLPIVASVPDRTIYTDRTHGAWPVSGLNLIIASLSTFPFFLVEPGISYIA